MEWKLFNEDDGDDFNEVEVKEISLVDDSEPVEAAVVEKVVKVARPANARRAIEILREKKQLEEDTWDYFDQQNIEQN